MDKTILTTVTTTVASVIIVVGPVILNDIRFMRVLRKESHVNREYERGTYMKEVFT